MLYCTVPAHGFKRGTSRALSPPNQWSIICTAQKARQGRRGADEPPVAFLGKDSVIITTTRSPIGSELTTARTKGAGRRQSQNQPLARLQSNPNATYPFRSELPTAAMTYGPTQRGARERTRKWPGRAHFLRDTATARHPNRPTHLGIQGTLEPAQIRWNERTTTARAYAVRIGSSPHKLSLIK